MQEYEQPHYLFPKGALHWTTLLSFLPSPYFKTGVQLTLGNTSGTSITEQCVNIKQLFLKRNTWLTASSVETHRAGGLSRLDGVQECSLHPQTQTQGQERRDLP